MSWSLSLVLAAGLVHADTTGNVYENYGEAWKKAQSEDKPLLVILNPAEEATECIKLDDVQKTEERRDLLASYVVAVVDTGSEHGKKVHEAFKQPALPRVVVIDKEQKHQIFKTSQKMYGQLWTHVLEEYKDGDLDAHTKAAPTSPGYCPTCPNQRAAAPAQQYYRPAPGMRGYCPTCR